MVRGSFKILGSLSTRGSFVWQEGYWFSPYSLVHS